jgi:hypothetical protein
MYKTCPRCGHPQPTGKSRQCPACGLDFRVWLKQQLQASLPPVAPEATAEESAEADAAESRLDQIKQLLFAPPGGGSAAFYARLAAYAVFFLWGWHFILLDFRGNEIGNSFMHNINLVFHEAGHVIFRLFGNFMQVLGGTLGQLLMPLVAMIALLWQNRDNFGASLGLWWLGQSLMDCAPYINDARAGQLMLLGGVTGQDMPDYHDWQNLLGRLGWLQYDHALAALADGAGTAVMLLAMAWGGMLLYRQHQAG